MRFAVTIGAMVVLRRPVARLPVRRLATPTGFGLVALCLLLPVVTASCSGAEIEVPESQSQRWRVSHTGVDLLTGGQPDVAWDDGYSQRGLRALDEAGLVDLIGQPPAPLRPQPLAWLAIALIATAVVGTTVWWRARWSGILAAAAAMGAAASLYAATLRARDHAIEATASVLRRALTLSPDPPSTPLRQWEYFPWVRDQFHLAYGVWIAIGLLLAVGGINLGIAVTDTWRRRLPLAGGDIVDRRG
jgi:hypothetical protein